MQKQQVPKNLSYKRRERVYLSASLLRSFYLGLTKVPIKEKGKLNGKCKYLKGLVKLGLEDIEAEYMGIPMAFDSSENMETLDFYTTPNMKKRITELVDKYEDKRVDIIRKLIYLGLKKTAENDNKRLAANRIAKGL